MKRPPAAESTRPYNSPQRAAAAAQTREQLVAAARALMESLDSLRGFSLDAVAKKAGVTRLTVYNQFGSRRALLEAVFDDVAMQGGLHRVAQAMAEEDPHAALASLVAVFCDFFLSRKLVIESLMAAGAGDPDFKDSLRERNERRRKAIAVLVKRMQARGEVRRGAGKDLVDVLWALTGALFLMDLSLEGRGPEKVCALVQELAADAVSRAGPR